MQALSRLGEGIRQAPPLLVDAALILLVVAARLVQYGLDSEGHDPPVGTELAVAITLVAALPLLLRRRFPFEVVGAIGAGELALLFLDLHGVPFALLIAIYTVAERCSQVRSLVTLALVVAGATLAVVEVETAALVLEAIVSLVMAWALGALQRSRRIHAAEVERRLELLERERETQAELAASHERSRIARELHDVIAHGVSVMVMQAGGARRFLQRDPERADRAMAEVANTGRRSLAEMRRLLGLLDRDGEPAELAPQPGLDRLDELLERFRRAELPVEVTIEGDRRELPSGVDLSAFRIIQEALTNVLKHAGHVPVSVRLRYGDEDLRLEILDRGNGRRPTAESATAGRGLIGMRERAALHGGQLRAGPEAGGGFRVECDLPLRSP